MTDLKIGPSTVLVAIPTYNEKDNVIPLLELFKGVPGDFHIAYFDDNSPDGTAAEVERAQKDWPNLLLIRRPGKLGLGTAHRDAIRYAYAQGYSYIATLDADLTHDPRLLPEFFNLIERAEVVVGSRHLLPDSLPGWNLYRRAMTYLGHFLTRFFLKMPYDATGALRIYNLKRIPQGNFALVRSPGYSFLYESLFILWNNGCRVAEIPIELPARHYGSSKMTVEQIFVSAFRLVLLYSNVRQSPDLYLNKNLPERLAQTDGSSWDRYWSGGPREGAADLVFEVCTVWFRGLFTKPFLERIMYRFFGPRLRVLHAGCGSGLVDLRLRHRLHLSACDVSLEAVRLYDQLNLPYSKAQQGDIRQLPYDSEEFDGIYNLGVMEYFQPEEIVQILLEFKRVLRPGGRVVLFWSPRRSPAGWARKAFHRLSSLLNRKLQTPPEPPAPGALQSRQQAEDYLRAAGLRPIYHEFGLRDLFSHHVLVAEKA